MEERLDDAIHVLRTHAEGSLPPGMSPVVAGSLLSAAAAASASGVQGVSYSTSVGSSSTSAVPMDQMVKQTCFELYFHSYCHLFGMIVDPCNSSLTCTQNKTRMKMKLCLHVQMLECCPLKEVSEAEIQVNAAKKINKLKTG